MRAKSKEKYEETHSPRYLDFIRRDLCAAGTRLVCSKRGCDVKGSAIAQQLGLTPQQKEKVLPILASEVPKVQAIKNDNSLSKFQKIQQLKAIHQQTDPQMKAILSPEQYQKLKTIRRQTIGDAVQGRI